MNESEIPDWQSRYEQHDTPWDKGAPAPELVRYLGTGAISGRVLVPGCGRGHEVLALGAWPGCDAVGLDLSATAMAEATKSALARGINAEFVTGDFFRLPSAMPGTFDWLVEHTCFCAIDPKRRADYVLAAKLALRKGGRIFGIFYLDPGVESGPPFAVSKEELAALLDPHFDLIEEWLPRESFPGRENREWIRIMEKR
jgi:SAM-dependent methyltransferase